MYLAAQQSGQLGLEVHVERARPQRWHACTPRPPSKVRDTIGSVDPRRHAMVTQAGFHNEPEP
jgi:hypothetical protein